MDIVVKGRNVEVPEHFRIHVADKLAKVERYDQKLIRVDVELFHERNPRQSDHCQRVEITCASRGPVVRAEACASDFYAALDAAITRLDSRLRRAADRRRVSRGRTPVSVAEHTAGLQAAEPVVPAARRAKNTATAVLDDPADRYAVAEDEQDDQPWHVARVKEHPGEPMTVDDALFQMELVGHDFYLFNDKESGQPSVVYRRKGYDYGIISLQV
ncbi:SSU ribosomal protein S30P /sigma 54 modulation protein [Asanoa ferruginea]|uniref:Ribosome hibernation promoting factor n=1 Tax=Asanoa ferruginea TaxID=53367 RepID=A0A3D9ZN15_9ACTN|nr:ribosome-associated translation inhibitor RaiA [Asanoa ferruginea]REF95040.1 SSU ribosomal protein S30P /sigma 54 modulation protein [Asanoa ferruginea]GIF48854.1 ribosomal subunit interface protein [Asanoa ferruginea]